MSSRARRAAALILVVPAAVLQTACGAARNPSSSPASRASALGRVQIITADQIGSMSAETAWDVVQRRAPQTAIELLGRTPPSSLGRQWTYPPLVVVDGQPAADPRTLVLIRADEIHSIRILGAIDGNSIYGPRGAGGAIEVVTRNR